MAGGKDTIANGELQVEAGVLRYESAATRFRLPLDEIVLVGEYTTSNGPGAIDYFVVFFTHDGLRYDASFYAKGRDAALEMLSDYWQVPVELQLAASTSLASNIVWPSSHAGQELFEFHQQPATKFFGRLLERIGLTTFEQRLSAAAQQVLGRTVHGFEALLDDARREFDRDPRRALEITERATRWSSQIDSDNLTRTRLRARAWKEHGNALFMTGRLPEALEAATKAQGIFSGDPALAVERASATLLMSLIASRAGDRGVALQLLDECAAVFHSHGEQAKRLMALEVRAIILFDLKQFQDALQTLRTAHSEAETMGLEPELARIENNAARCLLKLGELAEASRWAERAEKRFATLGMDSEVLRTRWTIKLIAAKSRKGRKAIKELQRLKPEFKRRGMNGDAAILDQDIAELERAA
jgi:tetratricopeptide (TPR) repeat protein